MASKYADLLEEDDTESPAATPALRALAAYQKLAPEERANARRQLDARAPVGGPQMGVGEAMTRGAGAGIIPGFGDEAVAATRASGSRLLAAWQALKDKGIGAAAGEVSPTKYVNDYDAIRSGINQQNVKAEKDQPVAYRASKFAAEIPASMAMGNAVAPIARGMGLGRIAWQGMKAGGAVGALRGAGDAESVGDIPSEALKQGAFGAAAGGLLAPITSPVATYQAVKPVAKAIPGAAKDAISGGSALEALLSPKLAIAKGVGRFVKGIIDRMPKNEAGETSPEAIRAFARDLPDEAAKRLLTALDHAASTGELDAGQQALRDVVKEHIDKVAAGELNPMFGVGSQRASPIGMDFPNTPEGQWQRAVWEGGGKSPGGSNPAMQALKNMSNRAAPAEGSAAAGSAEHSELERLMREKAIKDLGPAFPVDEGVRSGTKVIDPNELSTTANFRRPR